mgnify:CR=1 FL=1
MRAFNLSLAAMIFAAFDLNAEIRFERVPDGGIQPQLILDENGRQHLLYFKGDAMGGDVFYATRGRDEKEFSPPIKINEQANSVIVAGTMRGPQMALGRDGRAHVVWMGGNGADKVKVGDEMVTPLLYARMNDGRDGFEPERNMLTRAAGLDGGQTVAADQKRNVYVIWHGAPPGVEGEENRALYVARSRNDGKTFAPEEKAILGGKLGACACCGLRAEVDEGGVLHVLFRSAEAGVNRNQLWLTSRDGKTFSRVIESEWKIATCPASSSSLAFTGDAALGAWETEHGIIGMIRREGAAPLTLRPEVSGKSKHPRVAINRRGEIILTWVEGAGWGEKGTLACQQFNAKGEQMGAPVRRLELPAWSFGAPYATAAGDFVVLH